MAAELVTPTGVLVTDAAPETSEWFAARREGITGTDLPKILGLSKYGNALSVWLDKRGELEDEVSEAGLWGQKFEDPVAQEWALRQGASVIPVGVIRNAEHAWRRASLDRVVEDCPDGDGLCGLEVKTRSAFKAGQYREDVPDDVLAQVAWGRLVTGFHHMHVAVLIGGQELRTFRVDHDPQLDEYLIEAGESVWSAVMEGFPPEAHPDADGVLLDLLNKVYEKRAGERDLDPDKAKELLDQYAVASDLAKDAERAKTRAKTALVQLLDDGDTGLLDGRVAFTYKRPEPGVTFKADALRKFAKDQPTAYAALLEAGYITATNPGPRFDMKEI